MCPGCATGCNAFLEIDRGRALRLRPRRNDEVNSSWMCDAGRRESFQIEADRLSQPIASGVEVDWAGAMVSVSKILAPLKKSDPLRIGAVISYDATCEEAWLLQKFMSDVIGHPQMAALPRRAEGPADDFLVDADKHPNRLGVLLVLRDNLTPEPATYFDTLDAVIGLDVDPTEDIHDELVRRAFSGVKHHIMLSSRSSAVTASSSVLLPVTSFAEKSGTWVNRQGRVQRLTPAFAATDRKSQGRDALEIITLMARAMHAEWQAPAVPDLFAEVAAERQRFAGLAFDELGHRGLRLSKPESGEGGAS